MKRTIRTLGWRFNADRMVMDYTLKCYVPAAADFERFAAKAVGTIPPWRAGVLARRRRLDLHESLEAEHRL